MDLLLLIPQAAMKGINSGLRAKAERLLAMADVKIGGDRPWDISVHHEAIYGRVFANPSVGLGESYMDGWWDCPQVDQLIAHILAANLERELPLTVPIIVGALKARLFNLQRREAAFRSGAASYELGNELYGRMLDREMVYSCGYWNDATNLEEAQEAKLELVCRKLGLRSGMRVLDVGSGWGGFARYAVTHYGAQVVGITVSKEQLKYSMEHGRGLPLEFRLQDYRDVHETFDRIVSIGMFEHVGHKNYREYMRTMRRNLAEDGIFLLQTIGADKTVIYTDSWAQRCIFPAGHIPSAKQLTAALEGLFVMEDWQNIGAHYYKTLMEWYSRFDASWSELKPSYGDRFRRMWNYYLLSSAGAFRARKLQLWQVVLSKHGLPGGFSLSPPPSREVTNGAAGVPGVMAAPDTRGGGVT